MPVTARLSRKFYEKLGEDIAQELVDWFNMVDATYREDLRKTNELNFARFDAKLEQRVAELNAMIGQLGTNLNAKIDKRTAELDTKIDQLGTDLNAKIDQLATDLNTKIDTRLAEQTAELRQDIRAIEKQVAATRADLIKWTFVFWATTALVVIGLATRLT